MKKIILLCVMFGLLSNLAVANDETLTYPDGTKYVGEVKDGKPHGNGVMILENGDRYVGQWKDGLENGNGMETFSNGDKYIGQYKNGYRHGKGILYYPDGSIYQKGNFQSGEYIGE